jgi:hypothetical protein
VSASAARDAIVRFFPEPPDYSTHELGILFRFQGRRLFVDAHRVVEITPPVPTSPLPGEAGRGVAFWRGGAHEVRTGTAPAVAFLLLKTEGREFFVASEENPRAVRRKELPAGVEDLPEEL